MSALNDFYNGLKNRFKSGSSSSSGSGNKEILTHSTQNLFTVFVCGLLPDPDLVLKKGGFTSSAYYELLNDAHVGGSIMQRKSRVKRMEIVHLSGDPADDKANQALEFFQEQMEGVERIPEVVSECLDAPMFGANYIEMFWDRIPISSENPNGRINLVDLVSKPFEWFAYNKDNELKIKSANSTFCKLFDIPENKILPVVKDGTYRNPYGDRALKRAFWPYQFKKGGLRFWTEFLEKYGMPFLYGTMDKKKSQDELDAFHDDLVEMVRNGVIVSSSDGKEEINVVEAKGKSGSNDAYKTYKNAMNIEISKAILGETLTIENSESGSQAATETHLEVLESIQDEDKLMVQRTFDRLARLVTNLNFGKDVKSPKTVLFDPKELSLKQAERDGTLTEKLNVRFKKEYVAKTYKIEEDDFDIIEPAAIVVPAGDTPKTTTGEKDSTSTTDKDSPESGTEKEPDFAEQFPIQDGVDSFIEGSIKSMDFLTDDLRLKLTKILKASTDYGELIVNLASLKDAVDSETFAQMLGQSLDIAYAVGEYAVTEDKI